MLFAQHVIRNANSGAFSLIEVFDGLNLPAYPFLLSCHVVTMFSESKGDFNFRIRVRRDSVVVQESEPLTVVPATEPNISISIQLAPIAVESPGVLSFFAVVNDAELHEQRLPFRLQTRQ